MLQNITTAVYSRLKSYNTIYVIFTVLSRCYKPIGI